MICLIRFNKERDILGWIIGDDIEDVRRQARTVANFQPDTLPACVELHKWEAAPVPGKYRIVELSDGSCYVLLVS
jgi:hypothetical protein